jgi:hypothetical protein
VHINNTNPTLIAGSPERMHVEPRGLGGGRRRNGDRAVKPMTPFELEAQLRDIGARRYHRLHPFHVLLHGGRCTKGQVQAWALNRYYYQAMIPRKDAGLIAHAAMIPHCAGSGGNASSTMTAKAKAPAALHAGSS